MSGPRKATEGAETVTITEIYIIIGIAFAAYLWTGNVSNIVSLIGGLIWPAAIPITIYEWVRLRRIERETTRLHKEYREAFQRVHGSGKDRENERADEARDNEIS